MFKIFLPAIMVFWTTCASAMLPESGIWWNPNESGSGYVIEIQDNVLSFTTYGYEPTGIPLWVYSAGTMTGDNQYSGTLVKSGGGQCLTCNYQPPTSSTAAGSVQILFDTPSTATLTLNGTRVTRIQRFAFAVNEATPYKLMGDWSFIIGSFNSPIYTGERLGFSSTFTNTDGFLMASGSRLGSTPNSAIGRRSADGSWYILLDTSPSYYDFYSFRFSGLNTMEGRMWTFPKSGTMSGAGTAFVGLRTGGATSVATGSGLALQKLANLTNMTLYDNIAAARSQLTAIESTDPAIIQMTNSAIAVLQQMPRP